VLGASIPFTGGAWRPRAIMCLLALALAACSTPGTPQPTRAFAPTIPPYPRGAQFAVGHQSPGPVNQWLAAVITFETDDDMARVFAYYRETLAANGWRPFDSDSMSNVQACPWYLLEFQQAGRRYELQLKQSACPPAG